MEVGLAQTPPKLKLAAALFFYTAQRPSDIMVMDWSQVFIRNGKIWIKLKQQKTGELIEVPAHRRPADALSPVPMERRSGLMVPSPRA
ncbi:MAG: hypothetical protein ABSC06_37810 [Rhodopila sp.]